MGNELRHGDSGPSEEMSTNTSGEQVTAEGDTSRKFSGNSQLGNSCPICGLTKENLESHIKDHEKEALSILATLDDPMT
jgi:hypothetical protein